jgi:hypothetical protein
MQDTLTVMVSESRWIIRRFVPVVRMMTQVLCLSLIVRLGVPAVFPSAPSVGCAVRFARITPISEGG